MSDEDTDLETEQVEQERVSDEGTDHETEEAGLDSHPNGSGEGSPEDPPKSRKRVRRPEKWKKTKRAKQRNSGEAYTSTSGKQVVYPHTSDFTCTAFLPLKHMGSVHLLFLYTYLLSVQHTSLSLTPSVMQYTYCLSL